MQSSGQHWVLTTQYTVLSTHHIDTQYLSIYWGWLNSSAQSRAAAIIIFQLPYLSRAAQDELGEPAGRWNARGWAVEGSRTGKWDACSPAFAFVVRSHRLMASISDSIRRYCLTTMCDLRLVIDWLATAIHFPPTTPHPQPLVMLAAALAQTSCNFSQLAARLPHAVLCNTCEHMKFVWAA